MRTRLTAALLTLVCFLAACDRQPPAPGGATTGTTADTTAAAGPDLASDEAKVSYMVGFGTAQQLSSQGLAIDGDAFTAGAADALAGAEPRVPPEAAEAAMAAVGERMSAEAEKRQTASAAENQQRSVEFLAANANEEGVVTTESGLQYKIITEGSGPKPTADGRVQVHYEGRLVNGRVFDSSIERGEPIVFGVTQVIPGWTEALQLMPEGSKWRLFIPPELAYGMNAPPSIGPNQALIFDVELLQADAGEE